MRTEMKRRSVAGMVFFLITAFLLAGEEISLSLDEAVEKALEGDLRLRSAVLEREAAQIEQDRAFYDRWLPSLSLSGGYTRLSHVTTSIDFGGYAFDIDSNDDSFSLAGNLNYTLFAGFRMREAEELARLQVKGKDISLDLTRQAVEFETKRAYWEAFRATENAALMEQSLALTEKNRDLIAKKVRSGTLLNADLLAAEMQCDQAGIELDRAEDGRDRAFLALQSLTGVGGDGEIPRYRFTADPSLLPLGELPRNEALIGEALAGRPESRAAELAVEMTETGRDLSKASLSPVLSLIGNCTYANPNSRVFLQTDSQFTGTWYGGITLSYDLGRIPSRLSDVKEKESELEKSRTELARRMELIARDVKSCRLAYELADRNLGRVSHMLEQARENERVLGERVFSGTAEDIDLLKASLARLRSEFAILNGQIDRQIAAADLARAAALDSLGGE